MGLLNELGRIPVVIENCKLIQVLLDLLLREWPEDLRLGLGEFILGHLLLVEYSLLSFGEQVKNVVADFFFDSLLLFFPNLLGDLAVQLSLVDEYLHLLDLLLLLSLVEDLILGEKFEAFFADVGYVQSPGRIPPETPVLVPTHIPPDLEKQGWDFLLLQPPDLRLHTHEILLRLYLLLNMVILRYPVVAEIKPVSDLETGLAINSWFEWLNNIRECDLAIIHPIYRNCEVKKG